MVDKANIDHFKPLLYIIHAALVKDRIDTVSVSDRANSLGIEYQILDLEENEFEVIHQF